MLVTLLTYHDLIFGQIFSEKLEIITIAVNSINKRVDIHIIISWAFFMEIEKLVSLNINTTWYFRDYSILKYSQKPQWW